MKPPPLLLLLLVAGFASCIPREGLDGGGAEDSVVPQFGVGNSGSSSRDLSEDADQQSVDHIPWEVRADDDTQARNDSRKPNFVQIQGEEDLSSLKPLSRSLRRFRYRVIPPRSRRRNRHGGRLRQNPVRFGANYNRIQQDDEDSGKKEEMEENRDGYGDDEEENGSDENDDEVQEVDDSGEEEEMEENSDGYGDDEEENGSDKNDDEVQEVDDDEEEEVYQPLRRPPKSRKRPPRKGWKRRRTRRFREGHEDTKRGYREDNNLDSDDEISPVLESQMIREKRQPGGNITGREGNENNTESDSSDSDDASETTPLLRGSRKTGHYSSRRKTTKQIPFPHIKYKKLRKKDTESENATKSGILSKFKSLFKKNGNKSNSYERFNRDIDDDHEYYGDRERKDIIKRWPKLKIFTRKKPANTSSRPNVIDNNNKNLDVIKSNRIAELKKIENRNTTTQSTYQGHMGSDSNKGGKNQKNFQNTVWFNWMSRNNKTKKAGKLSDSNIGDNKSQDIVKRGPFSIIKNWFKKKKKKAGYKRFRESESVDDGWRDDGYDEDNMYDNEQMDDAYGDETPLLLPERRKGRYRNQRGDLNLLERVLRNVALISSRLKEEATPNTFPPLFRGNREETQQNDLLGGNEDDKVSEYDDDDSEDEGIGREYDDDDDEEEEEEDEGKGQIYDYNEGEGKNRDYDENYESEVQNEENGDEYDD